ncbi:polycystin-1-like protein 3 isoform X2 [Pseudophryne corroboree]|uniref:polycystin-1-like protein 3 isoform X2 n=1 Tax=Pseudophryne corroboree TaxID=495146 RepID=UPI0030813C8F
MTLHPHIVKGRSLCIFKFCISNKKPAYAKPTVKKPATNTTVPPPNLDAFTPLPADSLKNMTIQAASQIVSDQVAQLDKAVTNIWEVSLVSKASDILTQIVNASDLLSPGAQVIQILDSSVLSMDYVEGALLSLRNGSIQNHSFSSNVCSMTVRRVMTSDLTSGSFSTSHPAPCQVTFPSSSVLRNITDAFQTLNVMVVALAVNPFTHLSPVEIVGPVVEISLESDDGGIDVNDMDEYIEIVLKKNQSTALNESNTDLAKDKDMILVVNVTSANHSLVIKVEPSIPVKLDLYLGFNGNPNSSFFLQNISLPDNDLYTWVLSPEKLLGGTGMYYVNVTVANTSLEVWAEGKSLALSTDIFATQCVFWDDDLRIWSVDGCYVGAASTVSETHCLCNHLTFFASTFLVMPHVVDLSDTLMLFANVANNPVGLALLGALVGFFLTVVTWASKKDKEDINKVRVAILTDNDPAFHSRYMVKVCTGYRMGSGTTSQVVLTLYGSEGQSDPHLLSDSGKQVFHRGAVDVFLLKTRNLGELHSLRLWHSNSGSSPSWYVHRVIVTDLSAQKTWYFLCDSWLAADFADCQLDRIFPSASQANLMSLRYLLFSATVEKILKDHLWFSVWTRCPWSPFTRVQRICCSLSLLFCNLVINIMFWDDHTDEESKTGQFLITWTQIKISFNSSMILIPVNLLIVQMFQLIQVQLNQVTPTLNKLRVSLPPKPPSKEAASQQLLRDVKDIVDFLRKYIVQVLGDSAEDLPSPNSDLVLDHIETLSHLVQSYICVQEESRDSKRVTVIRAQQCIFLHYLYKVLQKLQYQVASVDLTYATKPISYIQASNILYDLKQQLQSLNISGTPLPSSLTTSFPVSTTQKRCCRMPKCFTFLCWMFLFGLSAFSGYYMVLVSLSMTRDKAISWLISIILSFFHSVFLIPPLKVFAQTIFMLRVLRRSNIEDAGEEQQLYGILGLLASRADWELSGWRDPSNPVYQAPANKPTTSLKKQRLMEQKLSKLLHQIIVHIILLVSTMIMAYIDKSPNEYYLYLAIQNSFSGTFTNIGAIPDFYSWLQGTLLPNLYTVYPGFITDGNCFLVGSPRIRQLRRVPNSGGVPKLYDLEDSSSYGPEWSTDRSSNASADMWTYYTESELGGYPVMAYYGSYSGGGYIVELGLNRSSADSVISWLVTSNWLDSYTKAVFVEFNVYNANINLFCLAAFILETSVIGSLWPTTDLQIMRLYPTAESFFSFQFANEILFLIIILYTIVIQGMRLKEQKCSYFRQTRNILDLSIIAISCSNTALYIKRIILRSRDISRYQSDPSRYVSFSETATVDAAYGYSIAFLVSLMTVKLWNLLNLNPNMHLITMTLQKAWNEISGYLLTILILLVAYGISCNLLFGWTISNYRTISDSIVTIISLLIGIFNYDEVFNLDPVLGSLLIFTCIIFLVFVVVNIVLSALLNVFSRERKNPTPYEEKEIVDMVMLRLSGLFGKQKTTEEAATDKDKDKES